ncbi:low-specificity L-threonine aldolase [Aliidiomarina soli]|uniref:Low-specificity L-threonine aldolase n=1 Tax=Aliidiomarina soli TaxID=1928574 RepID=A0A432WN66_9GAMM|nr:low-specificity L-threonine aldolase [Aliidiomarina soli]RUO35159.1 low-specificity L-threonine aldolase [Aliidiomarina soli]
MIDLRSDTLTKPTPAMRDAMASALVGDDVYGEDPTVNALEQRVATLLGKEAALFCSSGTQSNLLGIMSQCQRGEEYLVGAPYHTYKYEAGGAAVLGGIVPQTLPLQADGSVQISDIEGAIKADDPHFPISRLIALENTHVGKVVPQQAMLDARELADKYGLNLHLDGARLFNASIATGLSVAELAAPFDSVSVCFSKGLGAPVGSMLCESAAIVGRARRWRKMLGGGMRQAGVLAAAVDYALDNHVQRLAEDHHHAQRLAEGLSEIASKHGQFSVEPVQTNMVYLNFGDPEQARQLSAGLREQGILVPPQQAMRLVTHLDVSSAQVEQVIRTMNQLLVP